MSLVAAFGLWGCGDSGGSATGASTGDGATTAATTTETGGSTGSDCPAIGEQASGYDVGLNVPDMVLSNCSGEMLSLHDQLCGKKAVMLYFGSGWCQPCIEKMPKVQQYHETYGDDLLVWVVLRENTGPHDPATKVFCEEWTNASSLTFPVVIDPTDKHTGNFLASAATYPVVVMASGDGLIQIVETGADADLETYIKALLE